MIKKFLQSKIILILLLSIFFVTACKKSGDDGKDQNSSDTVTFGALLPLTGPDSDEGTMSQSAIQLAIAELNEFMKSVGSGVRYNVVIKDMQSDTVVCLQKVKEFNNMGIKMLLGGPYNSDELAYIKNYLQANDMLMLNAFSTSPALSFAGDNIFRLLPDDTKQAAGIVTMLKYDSLSVMVPVYVNDLYGNGFIEQIKSGFVAQGGIVTTGISFAPGTTDFSTLIATLNTQVVQATGQYGADKVSVVMVTGEETVPIFQEARNYPALAAVQWIGTDGSACQNNIIQNPMVAQFAMDVHFIASVYEVGMENSGAYLPDIQNIANMITLATGKSPNSNTLNCYDAVKIYSDVYQTTGNLSLSAMKIALPVVCRNYCTGTHTPRELNEAGDIAKPVFGFWGIVHNNGTYEWKLIAHYFAENKEIDFIQP